MRFNLYLEIMDCFQKADSPDHNSSLHIQGVLTWDFMGAKLCRGLNHQRQVKLHPAAMGCRNVYSKQCIKPGSGGRMPSLCSRTTLNYVEHWEFGQFQRSVASVLRSGWSWGQGLYSGITSTWPWRLQSVTWLPSITFALMLAHAPSAIRLPKLRERYVCDQKMAAKSIYLGFFAVLASCSGSTES